MTLVSFLESQILSDQQITEIKDVLIPAVKKSEGKKMILNFAEVEFMSSAFLGLLVRLHKKACELNCQLQLRNLNNKIFKVFQITQLIKVFDIQ